MSSHGFFVEPSSEQEGFWSYFSPTVGTVHISTDVGDPVSTGEARNMVVTCADPKTVWGIVAGAAAWSVTEAEYVRGGMVFNGEFYYTCGNKVRVRDPATGAFIRDYSFPDATFINAVWVGDSMGFPALGVIYSGTGPDLVKLYDITSGQALVHTSPAMVSEARALYVAAGRIYVASTFDHLVKVIVISTGLIESQTAVYYPNDVRPLPDGRVLVTAEHENRIFKWDPATDAREMVLSAPVAPFNDITKTKAEIEAATPTTGATEPTYSPEYSPPKQIAAQEYHPGAISIYAPNAAFIDGAADLLVAPTDDHHVIIVRGGVVVTEVTGLNSPVGVAVF